MRTVQVSQKIGFDNLVYGFYRHILQHTGGHHAGVIYPNINPAIELKCCFSELLNLGGHSRICRHRQGHGSKVTAKLCCFVECLAATCRQYYIAALACECFRCCAANSAAGSCYYDCSTV